MKVLSLFVFATVFLLSSALPEGKGKGKGKQSSLLEVDDHRNVESLQRRKPPVKAPGPAFMSTDSHSEFTDQDLSNLKYLSEEENKNVYLTANERNKHLDSLDNNGKGKSKHLVNGDFKADGEESQGEKSKALRSDWNSP